jgi:hypothetical protein
MSILNAVDKQSFKKSAVPEIDYLYHWRFEFYFTGVK